MDIELDEYVDIPAPVLDAPPLYSDEIHTFLSGFKETPHAKRLLEYLLLLGLTLNELRQGLRHPRFLTHSATILGPAFISLPMEQKTASIRRVIASIEALTDDQIKEATAPPDRQPSKSKKTSKSKSRKKANCGTLRRLSVLASLYQEESGLPISEIEQRSCMGLRRLRDALRDLESAGHIKKAKSGKKFLYQLTHEGVTCLVSSSVTELSVTFLQYKIRDKSRRVYDRNVTFEPLNAYRLSEVIRESIKVVEELGKLKWRDHRCIRETLRTHTTEFILAQIAKIRARKMENPGGYLMRILLRPKHEWEQRADIARKNLAELPPHLVQCYHEEAASMTKSEARYFACALRKRYLKAQKKGESLFPGEVEATANHVRKLKNRKGRNILR